MDRAFIGTHEAFAETIRRQVPGVRVGWDGAMGYHWQSGYDFAQWTANLDLNQTYAKGWLQYDLLPRQQHASPAVLAEHRMSGRTRRS